MLLYVLNALGRLSGFPRLLPANTPRPRSTTKPITTRLRLYTSYVGGILVVSAPVNEGGEGGEGKWNISKVTKAQENSSLE